MKKVYSNQIRQVILILLMIGLFTACMTGCAERQSQQSYTAGRPLISLEWIEDKAYPLDDVTVDLSIGIYDFTDSNRDGYLITDNIDSFYGFALYYCASEYFEEFIRGEEVGEDRYWENYHFIKEIPADEALSDEYGVWVSLFNIYYRHTEKLIIPREIFEQYNGSFCIRIVPLGLKDNKIIVSGDPSSIIITYKIVDGEYVEFRI